MSSKFLLLDEAGTLTRGERVYLGDIKGKNEAWLRNTLFEHPELIPVEEIDPTFGPLVPLCKELRTEAGPIDAVFINEGGRLTIVECKLWKNPQARREVVAQALDYVSTLGKWTYADLQRQVAAATGEKGNLPFEFVRRRSASRLREHEFVDAVSRSLRAGRILVLIVGDGIREGAQSLAELLNRNATKDYSLGLIEIAHYRIGKDRLAIHPRILVETEIVKRHVTILNSVDGVASPVIEEADDEFDSQNRSSKLHLRAWWEPVLNMKFDDPEQDAPRWAATNNVVLNTPFPGLYIKAFALTQKGQGRVGVFLSGHRTDEIQDMLKRDRTLLLKDLPPGTELRIGETWPIVLETNIEGDDARRAWIMKALNRFVNALRPRLRRWYEEATD